MKRPTHLRVIGTSPPHSETTACGRPLRWLFVTDEYAQVTCKTCLNHVAAANQRMARAALHTCW